MGRGDGRLRDFVEDDAAVRRRVDAEDVGEMPCDGLALAVRVACEIDFRSVLRVFLERLDEVALAADVDVFRREVVVNIDAELALRQIAQVAHRSAHHVLAAEVFLDGLGLGWRLDDDERLLRRRPFLCRLFRRLLCLLLDGGGCFFVFFYLFCCSRHVITPFSRACIRAYHFPRRFP